MPLPDSSAKKDLLLSLGIVFSPLLLLLLGQLVAFALGCELPSEAAAKKCMLLGFDAGELIYGLLMAGYFGCGITLWAGMIFYRYRRWKSTNRWR